MLRRKVKKVAKEIKDTNSKIKWIRRILILMAIFLIIIYFILRIVYDSGRFTIILDDAGNPQSGLVIYDNLEEKKARQKLQAETVEFFTNISESWLPRDIGEYAGGSHNGTNYIAYTFYIENKSDNTMNYWYEVILDDVIKNVDEALRVMIILNGEETVYAKLNSATGLPEGDKIPFHSEEKVLVECRENFESGQIDKCTVVVWIEGDDPECLDNLIGGEIKMHMSIMESHINN